MLANDKGGNEVELEAVHRSPGIYLMTEKNPRGFHLGDHVMNAMLTVIAANSIPYLQMMSIGLHSKSGRVNEEKDRHGFSE